MKPGKDLEIDQDYWMTGVEFGQRRGSLIFDLMDLMDAEYQERAWIEDWKEVSRSPETSFNWNFQFPFEGIEDLGMFDYLEQKRMPYDRIGDWLKTKEEAEALYKVAEQLRPLPRECGTNAEYLASPRLPKLRQAAKEAFEIFMENEKDNKEFCNFIAQVKKREGPNPYVEEAKRSQNRK